MQNKEKLINYWLTSAKHDLETADGLLKIKKYDWCLYIGHLVLEKTLKAYFVKFIEEMPPKTHNLVFLADKANLEIDDNQKIFLEKVNDFNLEARYPDYKLSFYKLCDVNFTKENLSKIKEFYQWLLNKIS